jgi:hypothetical protein
LTLEVHKKLLGARSTLGARSGLQATSTSVPDEQGTSTCTRYGTFTVFIARLPVADLVLYALQVPITSL